MNWSGVEWTQLNWNETESLGIGTKKRFWFENAHDDHGEDHDYGDGDVDGENYLIRDE